MHRLEHLDGFGIEVAVEVERAAGLAVEPAALCLFLPFLAVPVPVEVDGAAGLDVVTQDAEDGFGLFFAAGDEGVHAFLETGECFGHCGVEHEHGACAVGRRPSRAELKAVSGESKGRRAVTVGVVDSQFGDLRDVQIHVVLRAELEEHLVAAVFNLVEQPRQFRAEE